MFKIYIFLFDRSDRKNVESYGDVLILPVRHFIQGTMLHSDKMAIDIFFFYPMMMSMAIGIDISSRRSSDGVNDMA